MAKLGFLLLAAVVAVPPAARSLATADDTAAPRITPPTVNRAVAMDVSARLDSLSGMAPVDDTSDEELSQQPSTGAPADNYSARIGAFRLPGCQ